MKILSVFVALTACLSSLVPALAAPPTAPVPAPSSQTFPLRHITPEALITMMHWNQSTFHVLPGAGTVHIEAEDRDNSLRVQGSPAALKAIQNIIRELDITPRTVQVKVEFFQASQKIVKATGIDSHWIPSLDSPTPPIFYAVSQSPGSDKMYAALKDHHISVSASPLILTTNNTAATIRIQDSVSRAFSITVSPRINSDSTLTLDIKLPTGHNQIYHTMNTVANGKAVLLVSPPDAHNQVQITFITPTLAEHS